MQNRIIPVAFILLWIVPVAWVGITRTNYPLYPTWIMPLFRVSGVFENGPSRMSIFFIEIRQDHDTAWRYINEKAFFSQTPPGERSRFQRLMLEIQDKPDEVSRLLMWIKDRLANTESAGAQLSEVRIIRFSAPPEVFLKDSRLAAVYQDAYKTKMPEVIVGTLP